MSDRPHETYTLWLGRGTRYITDQGEEPEPARPYVIFRPPGNRSINFYDCKLSSAFGITIKGKRSCAVTITAFISERSPDRPPWPDEPWRLGGTDPDYTDLSLYTVVFQQIWDIVDAPDDERSFIQIGGYVIPHGAFFADEIRVEPKSRKHPVVRELERIIAGTQSAVSWLVWIVTAMLVLELMRWFWR